MLEIEFQERKYPCQVWREEDGDLGPISFDTETTMIQNQEVPDFVIGSAFDGNKIYFIKHCDLLKFLNIHKQTNIYMANAPFDLCVVEKACGLSAIEMIESDGVIDIQLLGRLVDIAETGDILSSYSLKSLSERVLGFSLSKEDQGATGDILRVSFGRFRDEDGTIRYKDIPAEYLAYAGLDAIVTFKIANILTDRTEEICRKHGVPFEKLLSHNLQLKASYALYQVSRNGLCVDQEKRKETLNDLTHERDRAELYLREAGWDGGVSSLQSILRDLIETQGLILPKTSTGRISTRTEHLKSYSHLPFVENYLKFIKNRKLIEFLQNTGEKIHARFNPIVATGRTSSFSPNVQNFPRDERIRSTIRASPDHILLSVDYSQIELRALAQITYQRYGASKMLELLNDGVDLHSYFASVITKKSVSQVSDEERRKAKAANFGFPGGLGVESFVQYAKSNYGVAFSKEEARTLREQWLETFPEVKRYLEHDEVQILIDSGMLSGHPHGASEEVAYWILWGILNGRTQTKSSGREYTPEEVEWAFDLAIARLPSWMDRSGLLQKKGSKLVWQRFVQSFNVVRFQSGRVRSNLGFCQLKNSPFQGLAADGAKEALYELVKTGYRVVNFIHDEYLIEVPDVIMDIFQIKEAIRDILICHMQRHCTDVKIELETSDMINWE